MPRIVSELRWAVVKDEPVYQGPLQLIAGPERIKTDWWPEAMGQGYKHRAVNSDLTLRDYLIASSEQAGFLWIYR